MSRTTVYAWISSAFAVFILTAVPAAADTYQVIVHGKVQMEDGSPPPFSAVIERICSDAQGDVPGPLTNKKGEWIWRLEIDAFSTRSCIFRASHQGYTSTTTDASNLNVTSHDPTLTVPPLTLVPTTADPYAIRINDSDTPGKAKGPVNKAMKALDAHDSQTAAKEFQNAVTAAPKFAEGWQALGIVQNNLGKTAEARDAYTHAIEADPKMLPPYVTLTRACIKMKDWDCAAKNSATLIKLDTRKAYPEIHLHRAVALYELKDLAGAESSVQEALKQDARHKRPRAEYVLGRILEARGDMAGAKEHISNYIQLDPNAPDIEQVKAHLDGMGKEGTPDPDLEVL
jgi:Tfp pilus assembly protein PilF